NHISYVAQLAVSQPQNRMEATGDIICQHTIARHNVGINICEVHKGHHHVILNKDLAQHKDIAQLWTTILDPPPHQWQEGLIAFRPKTATLASTSSMSRAGQ
ncbi:hypothetical protein ACJX0J_036896, partial [Zea mays]